MGLVPAGAVRHRQAQGAAHAVDRHVAAEVAGGAHRRAVDLDRYVGVDAEAAQFDEFQTFPGGQVDVYGQTRAEIDALDVADVGLVSVDDDAVVSLQLALVDLQRVVTPAAVDDVKVVERVHAARHLFRDEKFVRVGSCYLVPRSSEQDRFRGVDEQGNDAVAHVVEADAAVDIAQNPAGRAGFAQFDGVVSGDLDLVEKALRDRAEIVMGRMGGAPGMYIEHRIDDGEDEGAARHAAFEQAGHDIHGRRHQGGGNVLVFHQLCDKDFGELPRGQKRLVSGQKRIGRRDRVRDVFQRRAVFVGPDPFAQQVHAGSAVKHYNGQADQGGPDFGTYRHFGAPLCIDCKLHFLFERERKAQLFREFIELIFIRATRD